MSFHVEGSISVRIGGKKITLNSHDMSQKRKTFRLPASQPVMVKLDDLNVWMQKHLKVDEIQFSGMQSDNLQINDFVIDSMGKFQMKLEFVFEEFQGWEIFEGFTVGSVEFEVARESENAPVISSLVTEQTEEGIRVIIKGANLENPTDVSFNGVKATNIISSRNDQILVELPHGATSGIVTVTTPEGKGKSMIPFQINSLNGVSKEYESGSFLN
jgi:hypothetical protein